MYSVHEGVRGISLDLSDHTETLMPITGTLFAVGVDFHAGTHLSFSQSFFFFFTTKDRMNERVCGFLHTEWKRN